MLPVPSLFKEGEERWLRECRSQVSSLCLSPPPSSVDLKGQRDLQLLTEVERNPGATQRSLAKKLGVALGLTNLYIKRLARKGYIKVTTIPSNRIKYLLTPRGIAEKTRLTYEYMQYSLNYYRDMRQKLKVVIASLLDRSTKRIVIYGTGEVAELAYLSLAEAGLMPVAFVGDHRSGSFLTCPVVSADALGGLDFDAVLVAQLKGVEAIKARLIEQGVSDQKIVSLAPQGLS